MIGISDFPLQMYLVMRSSGQAGKQAVGPSQEMRLRIYVGIRIASVNIIPINKQTQCIVIGSHSPAGGNNKAKDGRKEGT